MKYKVTLRSVSRINGGHIQKGSQKISALVVERLVGEWVCNTLPRIGEKISVVNLPLFTSYGKRREDAVVIAVEHVPTVGEGGKIQTEPRVVAQIVMDHSYVDISDGKTVESSSIRMIEETVSRFQNREWDHFRTKIVPPAKKIGLTPD